MSKKSKEKEITKRELLYSYWEKIPMVVNIELHSEEVLSHEVRHIIIHYMRKGKEEKWIDESKRIRHAFSAKELLDIANKKMEEEMKLQSLYFHLQKLQEIGLVEVICMLHEGRHNIAYFGRTARGFNFISKKDLSKYDDYFKEGGKLAHALNHNFPESKFTELLKRFKEINKEEEKKISNWLQEKEQFMIENNIDSATIFSFLKRINYHNQKMTKLMEEVAELLDFNF